MPDEKQVAATLRALVTQLREDVRLAGKRLRDRTEAIRAEAINPARGFDIGWQLGRLRDDVENTTFALMKEVAALLIDTGEEGQ